MATKRRKQGKAHKVVKRVPFPQPRGKKRTARVTLALSMHESTLAEIERRAVEADMPFRDYVVALFDSDKEDVPGARQNTKVRLWDALTLGEGT